MCGELALLLKPANWLTFYEFFGLSASGSVWHKELLALTWDEQTNILNEIFLMLCCCREKRKSKRIKIDFIRLWLYHHRMNNWLTGPSDFHRSSLVDSSRFVGSVLQCKIVIECMNSRFIFVMHGNSFLIEIDWFKWYCLGTQRVSLEKVHHLVHFIRVTAQQEKSIIVSCGGAVESRARERLQYTKITSLQKLSSHFQFIPKSIHLPSTLGRFNHQREKCD